MSGAAANGVIQCTEKVVTIQVAIAAAPAPTK
jgi:hypothetical protein